jgi:hypothetical protein
LLIWAATKIAPIVFQAQVETVVSEVSLIKRRMSITVPAPLVTESFQRTVEGLKKEVVSHWQFAVLVAA